MACADALATGRQASDGYPRSVACPVAPPSPHHLSVSPHMFASVNGTTLNYRSIGEGPPVVFVHGLGGSANVWHGVMEAMKQHHHCLAMDLRGHGRSDAGGTISVENLAKDVEQLIRHLELPTVTLVGHSMGTLIVQYLAQTKPELVNKIVLVAAISHFDPDTQQAYRDRADAVAKEGLDDIVDAWLEGAVSPQTHAMQPGGVGLLREMFLRNDPQSYAKATRALAAAPQIRRDELGQQVLVMVGAHDRSTPLAMAEELHRTIPVSRVEVVADVAHWVPMEAPGRVAASILEFLT